MQGHNDSHQYHDIHKRSEQGQEQKHSRRSPVADYAKLTGFHRAVPVLLFAIAIFVTICFLTKNTGVVGQAISALFLGLFAGGAFVIPVLLILHAVFYAGDLVEGRLLTRILFSLVTLISVSAVLYAIRNFGTDPDFRIADYFREGRELVGGGFIGSVVGFALMWMFDSVGVIVIALMILALYITFFFSRERGVFSYLGLKALAGIVGLFSLVERGVKKLLSKMKNARVSRKNAEVVESQRGLLEDDFFAVDNGLQELRIEELGIVETRSSEEIEKNPTLHERVRRDSESAPRTETRSWQAPSESPRMTENERRTVDMARDLYFAEVQNQTDEPIVIEPTVQESVPHKSHNDLSVHEVFTEGFDPFDFGRNLALSKKASSGLKTAAPEKTPLYAQSIGSIDEEDIARAKRREAFERRKAELMGKAAPQSPLRPEPEATEPSSAKLESETFEFAEGHGILHTAKQTPKHEVETFTFDGKASSDPLPFERAFRESAAEKTVSFHEKEPERRESDTAYTFSTTLQKRPEERLSVKNDAPPPRVQESESQVFSFENKEREPATEVRRDDVTPLVRAFETGRTETPAPSAQPTKPFSDAVAQKTLTASEPAPTLRVEREILTPPVIEETGETNAEAFDEIEEIEEEILEDEIDVCESIDEEESVTVEETPEEDILDDEPTPIPPEEQNPAVREMRSQFAFLRREDAEMQMQSEEDEDEAEEEEAYGFHETVDTFADDASDEEEDVPFEPTPRETSSRFNDYMNSLKKQSEERREAKAAEEKAPKAPKPVVDYSDYQYPPVDLLELPKIDPYDNSQAEINENGEKLIDTLDSFRVTASIKGVDRGPRITRYEVVPARGVKVSAITNLFDDISLALAADGVRMEAPIPGKSAIGFEIPNKNPATVYLRDLIESSEFRTNSSKTFVCIGKDVTGNPVFGDISKMPHVLVAGATGMGKSVCINSIMMSLLFRARPDEVKFIMIDPKKVEFSGYNGIPHLLVPVVIDPKQAAGALMWAVEEMEKRFDLIEQARVKKIDDYNAKVRENPELGTPMAKIVIVIDELNDLMVQVRDPVENLIMRIAQKARAAGIHLIIGTQRPSVNVITGVIKANIPSRISCKVSSNVDSRTILEQAGAEKLLDKGDMLFWPVGKPKAIRVQGAFVSDNEVESIMDYIRKQSKGDEYDADILEEINRAASKCSKSKDEDDEDGDRDHEESGEGYLNDQKFLDAVNVALNCGKISTSLLQRKVGLGFGRAARYIDIMEDLGVVGERNGQKPRDVLITKQEWNEMLSRRSLD